MRKPLLIALGKSISFASKLSNRGSGSTWPGHIALKFHKGFIKDLLKNSTTKIILVVGTNGKTTTTRILSTILEENDYKVFENTSGANLLNGIASSLLLQANLFGKLTADFAIFEVDENNLPLVLEEITPSVIIALDLFRDQLDRYGELDSIAHKWAEAFTKLPSSTHLVLNADDPLIAYLGLSLSSRTNVRALEDNDKGLRIKDENPRVIYFGLTTGKKQPTSHAADSIYCPKCSNKLLFDKITYSHLGEWKCLNCGLQRPIPKVTTSYFPLDGIYNEYNTLAADATSQALGLNSTQISTGLRAVTPAFGRQEKLTYKGKNVQIFLSKNPTGFNESLRTISENKAKHVLFLLNDRIPDGTDVSWIWDIDFEAYLDQFKSIAISGDRCWDMALRIEYAQKFQNPRNKKQENPNIQTFQNTKNALDMALNALPANETLYILPTYSAMLDIRKILTGRKIL